mgnify:FL=1|tara:strand:- start:84 stop:701 length:618 start_codon:yes stop_codon:yes gene_type:complete
MELNQQTLKKAYSFLSKDKCLKFLIDKFSDQININERYDNNYARALSYLIIEQQVSFKAAIKIKERFKKKIYNQSNIQVKNMDLDKLKSVGISYRKAQYIKNVYEYFENTNFDFLSASNENVILELTKIKGIGQWSSEMFLMFVLLRIDIFSKGDLALMNSIRLNYNIDKFDNYEIDTLIDSWSPYKTVASLLLWKSIEEDYIYS